MCGRGASMRIAVATFLLFASLQAYAQRFDSERVQHSPTSDHDLRDRIQLAQLRSAPADPPSTSFNFAESFSSPAGDIGIAIASRMHTAPSLNEYAETGVVIDRLEAMPNALRVAVGNRVTFENLVVIALDGQGRVVPNVPLAVIFEGPAATLDFESFRSTGDDIVAVAAGMVRIAIEVLAPTVADPPVRATVDLIVE
jgi:hypothetical protein